MLYLSISSLSRIKMPLNLRLIRALTSMTLFKTCNHFRISKLTPAIVPNPVSQQLYHMSAHLCSSNKDVVTHDSHSDKLLQNLESAYSAEDVLLLIRNYLSVMNASHQSYALNALFLKYRDNLANLSKEDLINKPEFKNLCNAILKHMRFAELNDQITFLKCLTFFNVPVQTKIMQSLLNLITKQVNDLTLQEIMYLDFLITRAEECPLVRALKIALPIVFEIKLEKQVNDTDVEFLSNCLKYASMRPVSSSCFDFLVSVLTAYENAIPTHIAVSILRSVCSWSRTNDSHRTLLLRIEDIIAGSANELNPSTVQLLLFKVLSKAEEYEFFHHEFFVEACVERIIQCDLPWKTLLHIMSMVSRSNYSCPQLADELGRKTEECQEEFSKQSFGAIIGFLHSLAQHSNTKPKNWDRLEQIIIDTFKKHLHNIYLPWQKIALFLAMLDSWPDDILRKAMDENYVREYLSHEKPMIAFRQLMNLHQSIELLYPGEINTHVSPEVWEKMTTSVLSDLRMNTDSDLPLLPALSKGLGGSEFIHNHVVTQYYHYLDHVIVMRKGGYATSADVSSSSSKDKLIRLQDIAVPSESLVIGILTIKPHLSSINGCVLRGQIMLYVRTLEAMGLAIVPIFLTKWNALAEHEKIPYLMQQLRNKTDDYEAMALL